MSASGRLRFLRKGAWVLAVVAAVAAALMSTLVTALSFAMSYGQPPDAYTGQDYDRALSWLLLAVSIAGIALAVTAIDVPARSRRLRAQARQTGVPLASWLGAQPAAFLLRNLLSVNLPLMIFLLTAVILTAISGVRFSFPPAWLPAGGLLGGIGAGIGLSVAELRLLRSAWNRDRHP